MTDPSILEEYERGATLHRHKGDALARRGRNDLALSAYETALSFIDQALQTLVDSPETSPTSVTPQFASEAAELLGIRGGIQRRLAGVGEETGTLEALESYQRGAALEAAHHLLQTYNRANAIKLALISGDSTVADLEDDIIALRDALEHRLKTDERAADDAWLWADLGDVRLLLGQAREARSAYKAFAAKARTDSPVSTLAVIKDVVAALKAHGDPHADRVAAAFADVEDMLEPS